jgi:signal transduction histidine kinase/CheY-like chemotaxis protein
VIGGMSAAAAGTVSIYLPAFQAYVLPALLALVARALLLGSPLHVAMGAMMFVFAVAMCFVAAVNSRSLTEAFRLRFELSSAQARLEETNRTLEQRVSERSAAFERQSEVLRDAQRMEAIGRLAGGVAHDFNNLLMVVLGNASDLLNNPRPSEALAGPLTEIRDAASRGSELVKQLLVFSRRQGVRPEVLDLNQALSTLTRLLARLTGERLTFHVSLHQEPLFVRIDPTQLEQVLINLVSNSRDATPEGGTITLETKPLVLQRSELGLKPGPYAVLTVSDTGEGMDSETRLRVFDPFFTTKQVGKGTGLGLATVYGIVDQSGGKIQVESERGRGSQFRVYLPQVAAPAAKEATPRPALVAAQAKRVAVLLVEDEVSVRAVTERMLRKAGHHVLTAEHAEQALLLMSRDAPSIELLITDVVMPGLSGPELALRLREQRPGLRTLFISGYSRDHVIPETDTTQGVAFLAKPFTYEALLETVSTLLADYPSEPAVSEAPPLAEAGKLR